jgi:hypothetical protein
MTAMETKILIGAGQLFLLMASYALLCASMSPRNTPAEKRALRIIGAPLVTPFCFGVASLIFPQ